MVQHPAPSSQHTKCRKVHNADMGPKLGVGMPKRRKKKVVAVQAAASEQAAANSVSMTEKPPPASPQLKPATLPKRAPPPSPGALKLKELDAAAAKAARELREAQASEQHAAFEFASAKKIYSAKLSSIDKAMKRKRRPLGRRKALNKLWDADIALRTAHHMHTQFQLMAARQLVKLRDAQNSVLNSKLRRKHAVWKPIGRAGSAMLRKTVHSTIPSQFPTTVCVERHTATAPMSNEREKLAAFHSQLDQYVGKLHAQRIAERQQAAV